MTPVTKPAGPEADTAGMRECGSGTGAAPHRPRGLAGSLGCLAVAGLALACAEPWAGDVHVARCLQVLRYRMPELTAISVEGVTRGPRLRTLRFRADTGDDAAVAPTVRDRITCRFAPGDPWSLAGAAIGNHALSPGEVTLVNAELLLLDLSENPERLGSRPPSPAPS